MIYSADIIPGLLPNAGSLLIVGRAGRSSIATYAATAIATGGLFFNQRAQQRPVLFFQSDYGDRRLEARKILDDVTEYAGLHIACSGCGPVGGTLHDRITENMTNAFDESSLGIGGVQIFDDLSEAFYEPLDALNPAKIIEAAKAILTNTSECEHPVIVMLDALPADILDGALRPLGGLFDVVAHIGLIGDGAWGRLTVIKSSVGVSGMFCDLEILPVEIGTDDSGRAVRAPAISPHIATLWTDSFAA